MNRLVVLRDAAQARPILADIWREIRESLAAGRPLQVEVKPMTRTADQNARLHALLSEIARSCEWAGKKRDLETWKRLMTAAWLRARSESIEVLPALDGHGIDVVFRRTSSLTVAECGELMEFVEAWAAQHLEFSA